MKALRMQPPAPVAVLGAGAFGTALAVVLAEGAGSAALWGRDAERMEALRISRENAAHLPGRRLPGKLRISAEIGEALGEGGAGRGIALLAVPTQALRSLLRTHREALAGHALVVCCKGVERGTGLLPTEVVESEIPGARTAVLTGPSFAADIAAGKPTALTLATRDPEGESLQAALSLATLRLYLSDDPVGAQLGGALKNVVAIGAGMAIGGDFGESARSALMTRGFAEMVRYAALRKARRETLFGLSGFGDLVLTCTSTQSRNYRHGLAFGAGKPPEEKATVEGVMTAHAVSEASAEEDLPVTHMVSALLKGELSIGEAVESLLSRPLRRED
ncbi:NAD(P)H-dependent glycerol-3-phosphate dehydrogenase [Neomegalonema sp.]|uniref:NAD(P)H-dependent glycerol-3-phosphate dehydrogenase n=1 Tax=Neomegalonema sp. TaxID=2039713 RepID=UPI002602D176|nr:NAD(P)H-dependent glycerol-3-phosphate dehydrogenase [Neomegalonema sp.]MDD2868532.1 NAD(P)-dependent glycerol-3-phosphate dehydrogenase [Neomegalonema sp.]